MGIEDDLLSILAGQAVPVAASIDVKPESSQEGTVPILEVVLVVVSVFIVASVMIVSSVFWCL